MQGNVRQSNAGQCKSRQSNAMQSMAMQSNAKQCKSRQSKAKQRTAKRSKPKTPAHQPNQGEPGLRGRRGTGGKAPFSKQCRFRFITGTPFSKQCRFRFVIGSRPLRGPGSPRAPCRGTGASGDAIFKTMQFSVRNGDAVFKTMQVSLHNGKEASERTRFPKQPGYDTPLVHKRSKNP